MANQKLSKPLKLLVRGLPLAGGAAASLLSLQKFGQQFLILIVLVWIQAYFLVEAFLAGK